MPAGASLRLLMSALLQPISGAGAHQVHISKLPKAAGQ
jgi:hypothetical protein